MVTVGKTYFFINYGTANSSTSTPRALNVIGSQASDITYATNICLWQYDTNDIMQKWKVVANSGGGYDLRCAAGTSNFCVDRRTSAATAADPLNNAQAYTSSDDSRVYFETTTVENRVRIYQNTSSGKLYLTAVSAANGTYNGKTSSSAGNVYWAASSTSNLQRWNAVEVGGGSSGGGDGNGYIGDDYTGLATNYQVADFSSEGYSSRNPFYSVNVSTGVRQCTFYCWGRNYERNGYRLNINGNGDQWYTYAVNNGLNTRTYSAGPVSNCIMSGYSNNSGHVLFVEQVVEESDRYRIYYSEANRNNTNYPDGCVRTAFVFKNNMRVMRNYGNTTDLMYNIQGYVVL